MSFWHGSLRRCCQTVLINIDVRIARLFSDRAFVRRSIPIFAPLLRVSKTQRAYIAVRWRWIEVVLIATDCCYYSRWLEHYLKETHKMLVD